jgi:hypothetical protein
MKTWKIPENKKKTKMRIKIIWKKIKLNKK